MTQDDRTYEGTLLKIMEQGTDRSDRTCMTCAHAIDKTIDALAPRFMCGAGHFKGLTISYGYGCKAWKS